MKSLFQKGECTIGGTNWSDSHYADAAKLRAASGTPTFAHHAAVSSGTAHGAHPSLDPKGVKVRESRDSPAHPEAVPVIVALDVTGSMAEVPKQVQAKLPQLMGLLIQRGFLAHPAIMTCGIGDATCDRVPLQVGQFEAGIEIESDLTNLYLEGGGGGQLTESYQNALYFFARHTVHDHHEKRGEKGYIFIIGDEMPYAEVRRDEVSKIIGATIEAAIPTEEIMREVQDRYHTFFILPRMTSNFDNKGVRKAWQKLVGENLIILDDADGICECIAAQIGLFEDNLKGDVEADLVAAGTDKAIASAVSRALVPVGAGGRKSKGSIQQVPDSGEPSGIGGF